MFVKPMTNIDLTIVRDGRSALRELKLGARFGTLTPETFHRLVVRVGAAFDEVSPLVDDSPDPTRVRLAAIEGGRRG